MNIRIISKTLPQYLHIHLTAVDTVDVGKSTKYILYLWVFSITSAVGNRDEDSKIIFYTEYPVQGYYTG
jgi:hypothetical protein